MVALAVEPSTLLPARHTAGLPGFCCVCGWEARYKLCERCRIAGTDPATGKLQPWLAALRREANRLWMQQHRLTQRGVVVVSLEEWLENADPAAPEPLPIEPPPRPRCRDTRTGRLLPTPRAPDVNRWLAAWRDADADPLVMLRQYSPSGVPLDMRQFLALLDSLCGWPPPGRTVDPGHREGLVDLYERVYEA